MLYVIIHLLTGRVVYQDSVWPLHLYMEYPNIDRVRFNMFENISQATQALDYLLCRYPKYVKEEFEIVTMTYSKFERLSSGVPHE